MESIVLNLKSKSGFINKNLKILTINGDFNKIILKSHIDTLSINGIYNEFDGVDPNCLIKNIFITGQYNALKLNMNCIKVIKDFKGSGNNINFFEAYIRNNVGINASENLLNFIENNNIRNNLEITSKVIPTTNQNPIRYMIPTANQNSIRYIIPGTNQNSNRYIIPATNQNSNRYIIPATNQNSNRHINQTNQVQNQNVNSRVNNSNQNTNSNIAQNSVNNSNVLFNDKNLSDFDKKKDNLFLEMDQFQYKHIQKYDSRRETECAICLEEFKRNDIIKEFYKCKHIFHKDCLKNWLKRANVCPLCKHDLTEDFNTKFE